MKTISIAGELLRPGQILVVPDAKWNAQADDWVKTGAVEVMRHKQGKRTIRSCIRTKVAAAPAEAEPAPEAPKKRRK